MSDTTDQDFFNQHIELHLDQLFSSALRLTRAHHEAEDLVADTVVKAWTHIQNLQDRDRFLPWMLRIMTNHFISNKRKIANKTYHETYKEETDDEDPFSIFDRLHQPFLLWWGNPEQQFLNDILSSEIEQALDQLKEEYRVVVILSDVEGLTYQEISQALEIPVGTVRSRLSRARSHMQKNLWQHAMERGLVPCPSQGEDHE